MGDIGDLLQGSVIGRSSHELAGREDPAWDQHPSRSGNLPGHSIDLVKLGELLAHGDRK
jgi:hypothetical protein